MITFIVNLLGLALMGFIVWWFWLSRSRAQQLSGCTPIEIVVENGSYTPAHIEVPQGELVKLSFMRRDPSPHAEKVLFDGLDITLHLPLEVRTEIVIGPLTPGEYGFSCQTQRYRGSLSAKEPLNKS